MASIQQKEKHILIAVDESDNARRAVLHVADFLGGLPGFRVTVLSILPEPAEDYFTSDEERTKWIDSARKRTTDMVGHYGQRLVQAGFPRDTVSPVVIMKRCSSIGECILEEQRNLVATTIVIGRRGLSKKEEFIFGSTSNKILHAARNCCVWVVE